MSVVLRLNYVELELESELKPKRSDDDRSRASGRNVRGWSEQGILGEHGAGGDRRAEEPQVLGGESILEVLVERVRERGALDWRAWCVLLIGSVSHRVLSAERPVACSEWRGANGEW